MAKQTIYETIVSDDVDPEVTQGVETISFSFMGTDYEIDLGPENAEQFNADIAHYVSHARKTAKTKGAKRAGGSVRGAADRERSQAIREWARGQGVEVSERGRIGAGVVAAYDLGHV